MGPQANRPPDGFGGLRPPAPAQPGRLRPPAPTPPQAGRQDKRKAPPQGSFFDTVGKHYFFSMTVIRPWP